jgi:hypothetical protein
VFGARFCFPEMAIGKHMGSMGRFFRRVRPPHRHFIRNPSVIISPAGVLGRPRSPSAALRPHLCSAQSGNACSAHVPRAQSNRVRGDLLFKESFLSSAGAKGEMTFSRRSFMIAYINFQKFGQNLP